MLKIFHLIEIYLHKINIIPDSLQSCLLKQASKQTNKKKATQAHIKETNSNNPVIISCINTIHILIHILIKNISLSIPTTKRYPKA